MGRLGSPLKRLSKTGGENRYIRGALALVQELFVILLITFILLLLVETIWEGSVSPYLNFNHLLVVVIGVGAIAVLAGSERVERKERGHLGTRDIIMLVCIGLAGVAIIWYKTQEVGWLSYVISSVSAGLIVLLSMIIWRGDEGTEQKSVKRTADIELKTRKEVTWVAKERANRETKEVLERARQQAMDTLVRGERKAKEVLERARQQAMDTLARGERKAKEAIDRAEEEAEDALKMDYEGS